MPRKPNPATKTIAAHPRRNFNRRFLASLQRERMLQSHLHGSLQHHGHTVGEWILILQRLVSKAGTEWYQGSRDHRKALYRIMQIAATSAACLDQHGIYDTRLGTDRPETEREKWIAVAAQELAKTFNMKKPNHIMHDWAASLAATYFDPGTGEWTPEFAVKEELSYCDA